jgi:hypothetical protein
LEQQRLSNLGNLKKKMLASEDFADIFNPKSAVIFINMTDSLGKIEKGSKRLSVI